VPWFVAQLLAVALLTGMVTAFYTLRLNPEVAYLRGSDRIKRAWARKMTLEHGPKTILFGGSSCEFSIDPEQLLARHGLPAVNLGRNAGLGASVLIEATLSETQPKDTLVMAIEPTLLTGPAEIPMLGGQFSFALGHPEWVLTPRFGRLRKSWPAALLALRPGGYHVFTLLGKLVQGRPLYRYNTAEVRPTGFHQTPVRMPLTTLTSHAGHLHPDSPGATRPPLPARPTSGATPACSAKSRSTAPSCATNSWAPMSCSDISPTPSSISTSPAQASARVNWATN